MKLSEWPSELHAIGISVLLVMRRVDRVDASRTRGTQRVFIAGQLLLLRVLGLSLLRIVVAVDGGGLCRRKEDCGE